MGKHVVVFIFLFLTMTSLTFSAEKANEFSWDSVKEDVKKLSRNSFYEKYREQLESRGLKAEVSSDFLEAQDVAKELDRIEGDFYAKGYSEWKEVKEIKDEFTQLYETSSAAYIVLKKRVNAFNLQVYKDKKISAKLRSQVNDALTVLSKKIDKHHSAKAAIPTVGEMVSTLADFKESSVIKTKQANSFWDNIEVSKKELMFGSVVLLFFVGIGVGVGRGFKSRRNSAPTHYEEVEENSSIIGEGLSRTGVIVVNASGEVESMNLRAGEILGGEISTGQTWDSFFEKNFYRGKKHLGVKGFYRFMKRPNQVFYINGNMDKISQVRTIEVSSMPLKEFDSALNLLERSSVRVDSMEVLDQTFSELINLGKINLSLDVFNLVYFGRGSDLIYLSEWEAKKYVTHVFKVIDSIHKHKSFSEISRIDVDREGSDFVIKTVFSHCQIKEQDLREKVSFDGQELKLSGLFNNFKKLSQSYESSLIVKNVTANGERKVEVKFKLQDNSNFQSLHRVKAIGKYANA